MKEWVNSPEIIVIHDIPEKLTSVLASEILDTQAPTPWPLFLLFL